jgi:hypothetical protein
MAIADFGTGFRAVQGHSPGAEADATGRDFAIVSEASVDARKNGNLT